MTMCSKNLVAYLALSCILAAPVFSEDDAVLLYDIDHPQHDSSLGTNDTKNGTGRVPYHDKTNFDGGMNGWDFMGIWGKFDLNDLSEEYRPIPINEERPDQEVFICHTSELESMLVKDFPALEDATLTLGYYAKTKTNDLSMSGLIEGPDGTAKEVFDYSEPSDLHEILGLWITQTFPLDIFAREGAFKLKLKFRSANSSALVGIDEMEVNGYLPKSAPIIATQAPLPEGNATNINVTEPSLNSNVTVDVNATTVANNITLGTNVTIDSNVTIDVNQTTLDVNSTMSHNGTNNATEAYGNETLATQGPNNSASNGGGPSTLSESNVTTSISSNYTENPPSNVSQDISGTNGSVTPSSIGNGTLQSNVSLSNNVTQFAPEFISKIPPQSNATNIPFGNATGYPAQNASIGHTPAPSSKDPISSNVTRIPPSSNFTQIPPISNATGIPVFGTSKNPDTNTENNSVIIPAKNNPDHPNYGDLSDNTFHNDVSKLAGVAQAIWDAFYVFLALFCACLVALVGLIVRGRCNSDPGTTTTPLQVSPPTTPGPPPTASIRSTTTQATRPMQYERSV